MKNSFEIVVVSSDLECRRYFADTLTKLGLDPICAATVRECNDSVARQNIGLVFCDAHVADGDYRDILNVHSGRKPRVVLISRSGNYGDLYSALQYGAFDVVSLPCRPTNIEWIVIQARRAASKETSDLSVRARADTSFIAGRQSTPRMSLQAK